jgi:hypothetical protein
MFSSSYAEVGKYQFIEKDTAILACDTETGKIYCVSIRVLNMATTEKQKKAASKWMLIFPGVED